MSEASRSKSLHWFDVDEYGTLSDSSFVPNTRRDQMYSGIPNDWSNSSAELCFAMSACRPLAWCIHELYQDARDGLEDQIDAVDEDTPSGRNQVVVLRAKLHGMPEEPEDNAERWLRDLDDATFRATIVPVVQRWLSDEPDYACEDDYLDQDASAEGIAFVVFRALDVDALNEMGIAIVEGDRPGSNLCVATLEVDIDTANKGAERTLQPFRFRRKPDGS
jgi:hypothetical protein